MAPGEANAFEYHWRYRARTTAARRILAGMAPHGWARFWPTTPRPAKLIRDLEYQALHPDWKPQEESY
jgi:hypothetical protein